MMGLTFSAEPEYGFEPVVPARRRGAGASKAPQRRWQSVYCLRYGRVLPANRELRLPGRLLRRGTRDDGHPLPECGHTPRRRCVGPAGTPRPQGRHSVRCPGGHRRQPDRLLGGLPGRAAVRLEVGATREAHPRATGVGGTALRAPRRQGRIRWPLFLGLACSGSAGGRHEPHALGHFCRLQRPGRDSVGNGGRPGWLPVRPWLGRGTELAGTHSVAVYPSTPDSARRLPGLPVGDLPQEQVARARREWSLARDSYYLRCPVSLFTASTVSGIESALDCAPCAPASTALAATVCSSPAVNTSVGMLSVRPLLISRTRSSPFPSGSVTSISAASSPPSRNRSRASDIDPDSTNVTSSCSAASASPNACVKTCLNSALSSTRRIRVPIPNPLRRGICIVDPHSNAQRNAADGGRQRYRTIARHTTKTG